MCRTFDTSDGVLLVGGGDALHRRYGVRARIVVEVGELMLAVSEYARIVVGRRRPQRPLTQ
jgi:hypothetical protein